jgi:hypothetical protein
MPPADELGAAATTRAERDAARRRRAEAERAGAAPPRTAAARRSADERPPAPWGSFPLSELAVFVALVLGIAGLVVWGDRGRVMLLAALALGSLAGLELSIREHLAGYRSHTTLLAGATTFASCTAVLLAAGTGGVPLRLLGALAALVFAIAFYGFRQLFKSRSGGLGFR